MTHWFIGLLLEVQRGFLLQKLSSVFQDDRVLFEEFDPFARDWLNNSLKKPSAKHPASKDDVIIMLQLRTNVRLGQSDDSISGLYLGIAINVREVFCGKSQSGVGVRLDLSWLEDVFDILEFAHYEII